MKKLLYLLAIVLLASCHSSKKAQKTDGADATAPTTTVTTPTKTQTPSKKISATEKLLQGVDSTSYANYTAKVKVGIKQNGKSISTSGSLKMQWNEVVQISLVDPILGITEVGRIEFSKDNILIVDRMNKQYVQESYKSLSALAKTDISFEYLQALFWSEAQKPNNNKITYKIPLKTPITLELDVSNVNHKDGWELHYQVSSKYNKVSIEELFKTLTSL